MRIRCTIVAMTASVLGLLAVPPHAAWAQTSPQDACNLYLSQNNLPATSASCSPTELALFQASPACLSCAFNATCLDDTLGDLGPECGDPGETASSVAGCIDWMEFDLKWINPVPPGTACPQNCMTHPPGSTLYCGCQLAAFNAFGPESLGGVQMAACMTRACPACSASQVVLPDAGTSTTGSPPPAPALGEWGVLALAGGLLGSGWKRLRSSRTAHRRSL
jgi:hypothetical protein